MFIDAAHDKFNVSRDIMSWLPKITDGGILAGHDINMPSVLKAVKTCLPFNTVVIKPKIRSWIYRVNYRDLG